MEKNDPLNQEKNLSNIKNNVSIGPNEADKVKEIDGNNAGKMTRVKQFMKEYGILGFVSYMTISTTSVLTIYMLLAAGIDVPILLERVGINLPNQGAKLGLIVTAVLVNKIILPFRIGAAIWITPKLGKFLEQNIDKQVSAKNRIN
ncbi:hypothetical protein ROZALSC1DRAFT_30570 [Rozella allomycis CSF55]|uniref:DUF1279 domain-containing protein n=1 Tax=Rozella allomycis (strain CSF55) TaxID=988480 RepID=A0A075AYM0_ROZAC|nr:hypothetical protein O9G_000394 [Rozella allomycis CSF55]RKP17659.1 hypothetical protein ROZALSC1DRAFT_30570 [Rozella allomycis CSF55]|eukprot:EPZ33619.1 hypothetical protein O9G_000394 [Rozella allomycis CSF55]